MAVNKQATVGAFVLGGVALTLAVIGLFGNFHPFGSTRRAIVVFQDSIAGLSIGAPVSFRGVKIGSVENIALQIDPIKHSTYIPVFVQLEINRIQITQDDNAPRRVTLENLVKHGMRAELNVQSFITGQAQVDLTFDPSSPLELHPELSNLPEIPAKLSAMQKVKDQLANLPLQQVADNANAMLATVRDLSTKLDTDLPPLIASLTQTSDQTRAMVDKATHVMADVQERLDTAIQDIDRLSVSADVQVKRGGDDLHHLLASANDTVIQAQKTLHGFDDLSNPRAAARVNIDSLLRDMAAAAASLRGFANDVEHNPQLLLTGRHP